MQVRELRIVYRAGDGTAPESRVPRILTAADARAVLAPILEAETVETFGLLCLSTRSEVLCYHEVSRGDLNRTIVHPREVFKAALLANAATVVLSHNHPSGDPTPSPDDLAMTDRLVAAGDVLGVLVLDHLIIGHGPRYFSFSEAGRLPRWNQS